MTKPTQNSETVDMVNAGLSARMLELMPTPETIPLTLLTMQINIENLTQRVNEQDILIAKLLEQLGGLTK